MKTLQECEKEVATKYKLGKTLVTGHMSKYWEEAAILYASQFQQQLSEKDKEIAELKQKLEAADLYARSKWDEACKAQQSAYFGNAIHAKPEFKP